MFLQSNTTHEMTEKVSSITHQKCSFKVRRYQYRTKLNPLFALISELGKLNFNLTQPCLNRPFR